MQPEIINLLLKSRLSLYILSPFMREKVTTKMSMKILLFFIAL